MLSVLAENPLFTATGAAYAVSAGFYASAWKSTKEWVGKAATAVLAFALVGNVALIVSRWIAAGRPPFKSLYESMVFLAFCIGSVYLGMEKLHRSRVFGALSTIGAFGAMTFAISKWDAEIVQLPPALQSAWFIPHVVVYFAGYAALFFATAVAIVQLVKPTLPVRAGTVLTGAPINMDAVGLGAIRFGFGLLSVGLLIGSVWAKGAWGDYWVWDPKENWALVTWLTYAALLHVRQVKGWTGRRMAWLTIAGFAVMMFTYLGMEMLPTAEASAHVYQG